MCLQQGGATLLSPSVRDAFFFCCFLVTFAVVGRQECRPSLSCFRYCYSYYLRLPIMLATRRGDTSVAQRSRCILFICCVLVTFAAVGRQECRPAFAMHSFFVAFLVTFAVVGRQGVSPLLELLSLCYSKLAKVANCVCNKEGRHSCRPAFAMHSFFVAFLVTFAAVGRQECRPSLSCFYYCCSY